MRDFLTDVARQTHSSFITLRITGSETETLVQSNVAAASFIYRAIAHEPVPEFIGSFGVSNLGLLNGLLHFPSYKTEGASVRAIRTVREGNETVEAIEFKATDKGKAVFRTMSANHPDCKDQVVVNPPTWPISLVPSKSKIAEFSNLVGMFREQEFFGISTQDGALIFTIGDENSSSHRVSMVFEEEVELEIDEEMLFRTANFLAVLKLAGNMAPTIGIHPRGLLGTTIKTEFATHEYYLRPAKA